MNSGPTPPSAACRCKHYHACQHAGDESVTRLASAGPAGPAGVVRPRRTDRLWPDLPRSGDPAGRIEAQWTGADTGRMTAAATAEWCEERRALEIAGVQGTPVWL